MNTSRASSSDLSVTSIRFSDNTVLTSGSTFTSNVHLKKRVRVEGDIDGGGNLIITQNSQVQGNSTVTGTTLLQGNVTVNGTTTFNGTLNFQSSLPYVDNQTGWGLSEWTIAGPSYNKEFDSLIMKIKALRAHVENYATIIYCDANTKIRNFMTVYDVGTYPLYSGSGFYNKKVVKPASNSIFLISNDAGYTTDFKFQKGAVASGKYLRCADSDGTVEWANITSTEIPTVSSIGTSNGATSSSSFSVIDTVGGNRGAYFYPNLPSNSGYNGKILAGDIGMLGGPGSASTGSTAFGFTLGSFNGNQAIRFTSDRTVDGVSTRGFTQISGGSSSSTLTMQNTGHVHSMGSSQFFRVNLTPLITTPAVTSQGNVIFDAQAWPLVTNSPVLQLMKSTPETNPERRSSIFMSPLSHANAYNKLVENYDSYFFAGHSDGTVNTRAQQLHFGWWSAYADALSVRNTIASEEPNPNATPPVTANTNFSGFIRLSACCSTTDVAVGAITKKIPNTYLIVDREGIKFKLESNKKAAFFGLTQILNYTQSILNDATTTARTGKFEVGTSSSNVNFDMNGILKYYYSSLGSTNVTNYLLSSSDAVGTMVWKTVAEMFPSTINKHVTFNEKISYTKNASTTLTSSTTAYCLGNDGLTGDVKWIKIPFSSSSDNVVKEKISFEDAISLYNQMIFITLDAGLITAAAVGGIVYAIASNNTRVGSQYWSSSDPGLSFYWRFEIAEPTSESPPFTYSFKIDQNAASAKVFKVANSYAPCTDFITTSNLTPNRFQFETHNKVVTDAYTKFYNTNLTDFEIVPVTAPANLCIAGNVNYRVYSSTGSGSYSTPAKGEVLVNWDGSTYTPPGSVSSQEYYGVATWKSIKNLLTPNYTGSHYYRDDVFIGSENAYTVTDIGASLSQTKTRGFLRI
jgi:hypothetical protein